MASAGLYSETYSGSCGDNLNWSFDTETNALVITGSGAMYDYGTFDSSNPSPWSEYRGMIQFISLPEGLTYVGACAFFGCVIQRLIIPEGVLAIGYSAFEECVDLVKMVLPSSLKTIEDRAFFYCRSLRIIVVNSEELPTVNGSWAFFKILPSQVTVYVPDAAVSAYSGAEPWNKFTVKSIDSFVHTVVFYDYYGDVLSEQTVKDGEAADVPQVPDVEGHYFLRWSNEEYLNVTEDIKVYAEYGTITCSFSVNAENGAVYIEMDPEYLALLAPRRSPAGEITWNEDHFEGIDEMDYGTIIRLTATPDEGFELKGWEVESENYEVEDMNVNPLKLTIKSDTKVKAVFEKEQSSGLEDINESDTRQSAARKVMIDGVVYILRDGTMYSASGKRIR